MSFVSVLTTVNAPYSVKLDGDTLAFFLKHAEVAANAPGHMSTFFGEVKPDLQKIFAASFGIGEAQLVSAAKSFAAYSGEFYPLAA